MKKIYVTGAAGFIGYHLCALLLKEGFQVAGLDGMTTYYDVTLKRRRVEMLTQTPGFTFIETRLENDKEVLDSVEKFAPQVIVHLAAQAGVRYSLENPRSYIDSNVVGTFNIMEAAREVGCGHLLMASTSSAYGANDAMPFGETDRAVTPLTIYAATKLANEAMAHSYAHLWNLPTTMFRFFTVYGPWGRPDMALFKFVKAGLAGEPIDVYGQGEMQRDFTYVEDLVRAIRLLIDAVPQRPESAVDIADGDSLSPVAPYRLVNIGNSQPTPLMDFIAAIEDELGVPIKRNIMGMQKGDVRATWANADLLQNLTGFTPATDIRDGVKHFVNWYRAYYHN